MGIVLLMILSASCLIQQLQCLESDHVKVTVYYESLCPDSMRFFTTQLEPTYKLLRNTDIMQIDLHAFGHANSTQKGDGTGFSFTCQHGPDECYGNQMLGCAKKYITNHETYVDFAFCAMGSGNAPYFGSACSRKVGVKYEPIGNCANTTRGEYILSDLGLQQDALDTTLTYVPWIIINDKFTQENLDLAQKDLLGLVCSTYKGNDIPEECP